jgi:MFS family permease
MVEAVKNNKNMTMLLVVIALAQFIITIDSTFMNVSISTLVVDLNTTVTAIQTTIALYTLVMAALMIPGAKIADIFGRKKIFLIGLAIYGVGTIVASLSHTIYTFALGWSFMEGVGASLMLPAMMALIAGNFPAGKQRTTAYALFAAIASIAAAFGPIVGGFFTTYLSWRLAFASEILVVMFIFYKQGIIRDSPLLGKIQKFDKGGFVLSAAGLITLVFGIILASSFGIIHTRTDVVVAGNVIIQAGQLSPTVWFSIAGLIILAGFYFYEQHRDQKGLSTLVNVRLLGVSAVKAGTTTILMQFIMLVGVIYALSLYLQMVLNYNAIQTGLTLLPLSIAVMISAPLSSRVFSTKYSPRAVMQVGFVLILLGVAAMAVTARDATSGWDFAIGLGLIGFGIGMVGSQNQNLMISSVPNQFSSETSGLINTFKNIGSSLGTSLAGALILVALTNVFIGQINASPAFSPTEKDQINAAATANVQVMNNQQFSDVVANTPQPQQQELETIYASSRNTALQRIYIMLALLGLLGMISTFLLPKTKPLNFISNPDKLPS